MTRFPTDVTDLGWVTSRDGYKSLRIRTRRRERAARVLESGLQSGFPRGVGYRRSVCDQARCAARRGATTNGGRTRVASARRLGDRPCRLARLSRGRGPACKPATIPTRGIRSQPRSAPTARSRERSTGSPPRRQRAEQRPVATCAVLDLELRCRGRPWPTSEVGLIEDGRRMRFNPKSRCAGAKSFVAPKRQGSLRQPAAIGAIAAAAFVSQPDIAD